MSAEIKPIQNCDMCPAHCRKGGVLRQEVGGQIITGKVHDMQGPLFAANPHTTPIIPEQAQHLAQSDMDSAFVTGVCPTSGITIDASLRKSK
jgi:hypothetical protein